MNRLLKFPRPKKATGRGYILGRIGRETHDSDDDLDGIYIDRRPMPAHPIQYDQDNQSIGVVGTTSSSDESNNDDQNAARSSTSGDSASRNIDIQQHSQSSPPPHHQHHQQQHPQKNQQKRQQQQQSSLLQFQHHQINIAPPTTPGSPKKPTIHSSSSFTNLPKMTTRYRFRDLLLGDFSFNDDGER